MTARPLYFGAQGQLFGWWEAPPEPPRGVVVLVESQGYEGMCAHWVFRRLSAQLGRIGIAVLRVDLKGTGNSGDAGPAGVVEAWKTSLGEACDAARAWAPGAPLGLVGLRLGATLAAHVAASRTDVDALALLEPVAQGRLWLREQKALALTSGLGIGKAAVEELGDGGQAVLGYPYSPRTQAELAQLNLTSLPTPPAKQVLVVHHASRPPDPRVLDALGRDGTTVFASEDDGLEALLQDSVFSQEPVVDFARLGSWLGTRFPDRVAAAAALVTSAHDHLAGEGWEETASLIGGDRQLAAVLCVPTGAAQREATLVMLNTGVNHHVGSHRTQVQLARTLAREGFPSLRFDLGGVGDSPLQRGQRQNFPYNPGSVEDTRVALDWLAASGHGSFVLTGICSGGYNSFHAALADERVCAVVLTNTQKFIWRQGDSIEISMRRGIKSTQHYQTAVRELNTWKRLARGDVDVRTVVPSLAKRFLRQGLRRVETGVSRTLGSRFERDPVGRGFLKLVERGVKVTFVLSADDGARDELDDHLGPGLGLLAGQPGVAVEILEGADHTLTARWARERLTEVILARLREAAP